MRLCAFVAVPMALAALAGAQPPKAARNVLPFKADRDHAAERAAGHRRPHGLSRTSSRSRSRCRPGRATRSSPAVPGFAHFFEHLMFRGTPTYAAREVPGDHGQGRRARERLHRRRRHDLLRDVREGGPRPDARRSTRTCSRTWRTPRRTSRPSRAPSSASTTRTARTRSRSCSRSSATARSPGPHLQAHDDGLPQGHREHAQPVPSTRRCSSAAGTGRSSRRSSSPATSTPTAVMPLVQKYWGGWKPGAAAAGARSRRNRRRRPGLRARPLGDADAALGDGRLPRARVLRDGKDYAAMDMVAALYFGETSDLYKKLVVDRAEGGRSSTRTSRATSTPRSFTVLARVKKADDAIYVRDEILQDRRAGARRPWYPRSASTKRSRSTATPGARAGQHRADRGAACRLRALPPVLRHDQQPITASTTP